MVNHEGSSRVDQLSRECVWIETHLIHPYLPTMKIPLNNFEQLIDPTILKRGLTYFKKGQVLQEGEGSTGELSFIVHGTEDYEVSITVNREVIEDFTCDCPYTDGPVCKHVVAIIFYLSQDALQLNESSDLPKIIKPKFGRPKAVNKLIPGEHTEQKVNPIQQHLDQPPARKKRQAATSIKSRKVSIKGQIEDIIQRLTPEEMKHFIMYQVSNNKALQADFLAMFAAKNEHESIDTYRNQIKAILSAAKDRYGFVDYKASSKVGSDVFVIAYRGLTQTENGNYRSAMYISMAVLEEMTKALEYVDDSSGDVGSNLDLAFGVLSTLSKKELSTELRQLLFDYAVEKYQSGEYEGWDWHLGMIEIALNLIRNQEEETLLLNLLNQQSHNEYNTERRQSLLYSLLLKGKDKTYAQQFLEQHLSNPDLKQIALQNAFALHDFERVRQLAFTAIEEDRKSKPGLLSDWYDWLIKVAEAEGDVKEIINYAKIQLLEHGRESLPYFQLIKKHTPSAEWTTTYGNLMEEMSVSRDWQVRGMIPQIMLEEQDWLNLLGYLKHEASESGYFFHRIAHYGQHLIPLYKVEVGELLEIALVTSAHAASKRRDYVDLTRDLRNMKKMGYKEIVKEIVHKLMAMYKHRPAMMEELRKL